MIIGYIIAGAAMAGGGWLFHRATRHHNAELTNLETRVVKLEKK